MAEYIDKLAYIYIKDSKVLVALSQGKDTWYIPGGKREPGESDKQALVREVQEELSVDLIPGSIQRYGVFEALAHGKPAGTVVRMTCYTAEFSGRLAASSEIAAIDFLAYHQAGQTRGVGRLVLDDLKQKNLIK